MSVFLRLAKSSVWTGAPADDARREQARASFRRRAEDTDGLSVFEVSNDSERDTVVAAIACGRKNTDPVDLLEVPPETLAEYGVTVATDGGTPLAAANALHRSLDWTDEKLEQLADRLLQDGAKARRYKPAEVRAKVRALDPSSVEGERAKEFVRGERAKASP